MLLIIRTTTAPALDLGYLLHKHPDRLQTFSLTFGTAHVFYPEAGEDACTVALLVEVDPVALVRSRKGPSGDGGALDRYVNDRPYSASSFLSVAIAEVFRSALAGKCNEKAEALERVMNFEVRISAIACRHGDDLLSRLFEPLGYEVSLAPVPLDPELTGAGASRYFGLNLRGAFTLKDLLQHLYVLIPVLDNEKHYWIGADEVEKLLAKGGDWLAAHPERELIARRYLRYRRSLVDAAIEQMSVDASDVEDLGVAEAEEEQLEKGLSLNEQRLGSALAVLKSSGAARVLDLGCGEGRLLRLLLGEKQFAEILGMDVSHRALEGAARHLHLDRLPDWQKNRVKLIQGSLIYRDERLAGYDAAAVIEVIEHLDPPRLRAFERVLFEFARPRTIVITTPNRDYNVMWESLPAGDFRHRDHRFEWSREEFESWARTVAGRFGYGVRFLPVGPEAPQVGAPTQMGVFEKP
jgi:3' terminal RNA ribose 2'-O-methyltransferase Hen1